MQTADFPLGRLCGRRQRLFPRTRAGKAARSLSDGATRRSESRTPLYQLPVSARWKTLVRGNVARPVGREMRADRGFPARATLPTTAESLPSESCGQGCSQWVRPGEASLRVLSGQKGRDNVNPAWPVTPVSARWKTLVRSNVARPAGREMRRPRISRSGDSADDGRVSSFGTIVRARLP